MDYVHNAWLGEKMEKQYQTKDIKATSSKKVEIFEKDDGLFYFEFEGETHGFTKKENAEIARKRLTGK